MSKDPPNFRLERIERLLHELKYEITRGMVEREIDETRGFQFVVPISNSIPGGAVICKFETRPVTKYHLAMDPNIYEPRLKVVK